VGAVVSARRADRIAAGALGLAARAGFRAGTALAAAGAAAMKTAGRLHGRAAELRDPAVRRARMLRERAAHGVRDLP